MVKQPSINDQLLVHIFRGGGVSSLIRNHISKWTDVNLYKDLGEFFKPEDDWDKLQYADNIAKIFLRRHDMEYIFPLWKMVSILELSRKLKYPKQTDHSLHTIYLYLLGIWVFDNSNILRKKYKSLNILPKDKSDFQKRFSIQWLFSSLLHDIGYIFENITEPEVQKNFSLIDEYFTKKGLKSILHCVNDEIINDIWKRALPFILNWRNKGEFPVYSSLNNPLDAINQLDKIPWLSQLKPSLPTSIASAFEYYPLSGRINSKIKHKPLGRYLKKYAIEVATNGYVPKSVGVVDHGYASGCLLFQLSSYKYWLISNFGKYYKEQIGCNIPKYFPGFSYNIDTLLHYILPACHAASAHNLLSNVSLCTKNQLLPYKINWSPLLFLSVLCDELQKWHRPPIGISYIKGDKKYLRPKVKEIYFEVNEYFNWQSIGINFLNDKIFDEIYKNLQRLDQNDLSSIMGYLGYGHELDQNRKILEILTP
jgi:hypothetical protein